MYCQCLHHLVAVVSIPNCPSASNPKVLLSHRNLPWPAKSALCPACTSRLVGERARSSSRLSTVLYTQHRVAGLILPGHIIYCYKGGARFPTGFFPILHRFGDTRVSLLGTLVCSDKHSSKQSFFYSRSST